MTRQQLLDCGKLWIVCDSDDKKLFEGNKTACLRYLREHGLWRSYRRGQTHMGQIIWEEESSMPRLF